MDPRSIDQGKFPVTHLLYECDDYAVAWGTWDSSREAMGIRWNGAAGDLGFPQTYGKPVWFILPAPFMLPTLQMLLVKSSLGDAGVDHSAVSDVLSGLRNSPRIAP